LNRNDHHVEFIGLRRQEKEMASHTIQGPTEVESTGAGTVHIGRNGGIAIATLRVALGFIFLWPFLDKLFGLGYSTASEKAWVSGGSPTKGFLSGVKTGPFESTFNSFAGAWWANILFMAALLAIGVALILGVALRVTAAAGSLLLVLMWAAEWPMAQFNSVGEATRSTNPFLDDHLIFALVLVVLAVIGAGKFFGLGNWWAGVTGNKSWLR
jgi:thiosulfate dehydrogenase (quinone) large subunit